MTQGFIVPTQVNYVGKGAKIFETGEMTTVAASVVSYYQCTSYLWDKVRVVGALCLPTFSHFLIVNKASLSLSRSLALSLSLCSRETRRRKAYSDIQGKQGGGV